MTTKEGSVVICPTGQAGTVVELVGSTADVLLVSGDIWRGAVFSLTPATKEMAESCPVLVERFTDREKSKSPKFNSGPKNTKWADSKEYSSNEED